MEQFRRDEPSLQTVPEAQIEATYIRPLFEALNWNVKNEGLSPTEYEFRLQNRDRSKKIPDYLLRLDGRDLLLMDAKRVKYRMHDTRWLNQVYRYAYSTQSSPEPRRIDFAVVTDFEEFVVLDCTLKADRPEAVQNFRILDWKYSDYVTEFDELWELFERDNMREARKNGTGLWARHLTPKSVGANQIPPDEAFLRELDDAQTGWRIRLAKDMKRNDSGLQGAVITAAVQLLIDRLVFTKALSDREIEDDYLNQLAQAVEGPEGYSGALKIFAKLDAIYNGTVFAPRPELEAVKVSGKVLRSIVEKMLPNGSPYNFAAMPVEILGTIYERFLGKVARTTDHQVKIEEKLEFRKAGGVYYTPQYIVQYIVKNTVGKLLATCRTPSDVAKLKIVDPACGSGSFLLGAYEYLVNWHKDYYGQKRLAKRDRDAAYYDADGIRLTAKLKREILTNNIYGVDIDPQAVEVTCFSLCLKALEDTRREELYEEVNLFKSTVLPDLSNNIKCGNSLIGTDFYQNQLFEVSEEVRRRVNAFDWRKEFPKIFDSGGFDAVIGNPPYIRVQRIHHDDADYIFQHYESPASKTDLSLLFLERGLQLISRSGYVGFICTSQWLYTDYGRKMRLMLSDGRMRAIADFGSLPVFQGVSTYPAVFFLRSTSGDRVSIKRLTERNQLSLEAIEAAPSKEIGVMGLTDAPWNLGGFDLLTVLKDNQVAWEPLSEFGKANIGTKSGMNAAFVVDQDTAVSKALEQDLLIPYAYQGSEVRRYEEVRPDAFIIYPYREGPDGIPILLTEPELRTYPNVYAHLLSFKEELRERKDSRKFYARGRQWYRHLRAGSWRYIRPPKLAFKGIAKRSSVGLLGTDTAFDGANCPSVILEDRLNEHPHYFLALLNSTLISEHLRAVCPPKLSGDTRFSASYITKVPVRILDFSDEGDRQRHARTVALTKEMLDLHAKLPGAMTEHETNAIQRHIQEVDDQVDRIVYELYGLTSSEVRQVEEAKRQRDSQEPASS